jgi:uncharacterized iron-regulated protein
MQRAAPPVSGRLPAHFEEPGAGTRYASARVPSILCLLLPGLFVACAARSPSGGTTPERIAPAWQSRLDVTHPLVGRIWDVRAARFVDQAALLDRVRRERFVAVGEQHDNPDHHVLEAFLVRIAAGAERRPAVVFEMLDVERQAAVDASLRAHPGDADALAVAVDWAHSGWPPYASYRPVFAEAVTRGLPIVAGGLDRAMARRVAHEGVAALDAGVVQRFALATPLPAKTAEEVRAEMRDAHCGMLPESMLDAMVLVQRARDAELAFRLLANGGKDGAVLVAGNGHVRGDRGVPAALQKATEKALSIALVEVRAEWQTPAQYGAAFDSVTLPFDYVWFTPRVSDEDHCAELRRGK